MRLLGWILIQSDWCPHMNGFRTHRLTEIMWGCSKKVTIYKPSAVALGETKPANTLISDFQLQDHEKMKLCCLSRPVFACCCYGGPSKLLHKHSQLGSCVSSQTVNKSPFHGLFSHVFFTFFCALGYDFVLMISLFKMSPKSSAKVLSDVPKHRKLWWCALQRKYKLDKLHPGVIYGAFGCEFDVNESALYIK